MHVDHLTELSATTESGRARLRRELEEILKPYLQLENWPPNVLDMATDRLTSTPGADLWIKKPSLKDCRKCGTHLFITVPDPDGLPVFKVAIDGPDGLPGRFYQLLVYTSEVLTTPPKCGIYYYAEQTAPGGLDDDDDIPYYHYHEHPGSAPEESPGHQSHDLVGTVQVTNLEAFEDICRATHPQHAQDATDDGSFGIAPSAYSNEEWVDEVVEAATNSTILDIEMMPKVDP